jgi:hypothetical protein
MELAKFLLKINLNRLEVNEPYPLNYRNFAIVCEHMGAHNQL